MTAEDELLAIATTDSTERTTEQEKGLISGLMDRTFIAFEFRDLQVQRTDDAIVVSDPETGETLGGQLALSGASVKDAHAWLVEKADEYATAGADQ